MSRRDLRAEALADVRAGRGAGAEALLEAALVALPFSGFLGIFVNVATGWPTPVPLLATLVVQGLLTLWIAGFRQRREG